MRLFTQLVAVGAVAFLGSLAVAAVKSNASLVLVVGPVAAVAMIATYAWVVRRTEGRAAVELALVGAVAPIARGLLMGTTMFAAAILAIALHGGYQVHGIGSVSGAVGILGFMTAVAVAEELVFRGVLFRILEERAGTWIAMLATGALFGVMHLLNPDATLWGAAAISIEAGFMLAACYAATRTLWVPIGLHLGWNVAAGGIFSVVVSGNGESTGLLDATTSGPALVSGGAFGPEGSIYAVAAGVAVTVVFLWIAHRRGTLVPRRDRAVGNARSTRTGLPVTVAR